MIQDLVREEIVQLGIIHEIHKLQVDVSRLQVPKLNETLLEHLQIKVGELLRDQEQIIFHLQNHCHDDCVTREEVIARIDDSVTEIDESVKKVLRNQSYNTRQKVKELETDLEKLQKQSESDRTVNETTEIEIKTEMYQHFVSLRTEISELERKVEEFPKPIEPIDPSIILTQVSRNLEVDRNLMDLSYKKLTEKLEEVQTWVHSKLEEPKPEPFDPTELQLEIKQLHTRIDQLETTVNDQLSSFLPKPEFEKLKYQLAEVQQQLTSVKDTS
jgi:hypothetical protein